MSRKFQVGDYVQLKKNCSILKRKPGCECNVCQNVTEFDVAIIKRIEPKHFVLKWKSGKISGLKCDYFKGYMKKISEEKAMVLMI